MRLLQKWPTCLVSFFSNLSYISLSARRKTRLMMDAFQYFVLLFTIPLCFFALSVKCRPFEHSKLPHYRILSQISESPSPAPEGSEPSSNQNSSDSASIFNVLSYGAAGDGVADDTQAFKMAWDAACQADDSAVFLVPKHYTFMIQSAILTGPCKNGLVFQVMVRTFFSPMLFPKVVLIAY